MAISSMATCLQGLEKVADGDSLTMQYTGMMLVEEMASILVTPYLLIFVVPKVNFAAAFEKLSYFLGI